MPETEIGSARASDLTGTMDDFEVDTQSLDSVTGQKESKWNNTKWTQYLGYYKTIPELRVAIDARATWTVGKGFIADEFTTMLLDTFDGWGGSNFNTILENMIRTMMVNGDSFAEIIRDDDDMLINLKPLNPGRINIVMNHQGRILRYEQTGGTKEGKVLKFDPERIFHLTRNRIGDEIHGVSVIESVENIILMRNEAMADYKVIMHRFVRPRWIFHLDTDDTTKIREFQVKCDSANNLGENLYVPKGAVVPELVAVSPNATLNPQKWIDSLNDYFYEACGTPKIIIGNSKNFTEASAKIVYLTFQQSVEEDQLYIETEVLKQLNLIINLVFPASLENELISDKPKEEGLGIKKPEIEKEQAFQPNDKIIEMEGRK